MNKSVLDRQREREVQRSGREGERESRRSATGKAAAVRREISESRVLGYPSHGSSSIRVTGPRVSESRVLGGGREGGVGGMARAGAPRFHCDEASSRLGAAKQ